MSKGDMKIQLAFILFAGVVCWAQATEGGKDKRQVGMAVVDNKEDHQGAESHFGHHVAASGKYFQDMYMAQLSPHEIEFGHVCENPDEWEQRFEKIDMAENRHLGKVRWGDKHGGYGEHHWDYNHAGHHDDHGEESQQKPEYVAYEETKEVPSYAAQASAKTAKFVTAPVQRGKRQHDVTDADLNDDVEFINEHARSLVLSGATGKHGGNYRKAPAYERGKRQGKEEIDGQNLVFKPETGLIVDEKTGITYKLQPVEY